MRHHALVGVVVSCLIVSCGATNAPAEVRLPAVISDNMALQRDQPIPIWGWADAGETVTVTLAGRSVSAKTTSDRRWQVTLPKLGAQSNPLEMMVRGSSGTSRVVKNVVVGEVWLATGPSNIHWAVRRCDNAKQEIATARHPKIRFFTVGRKAADGPQADCAGSWIECSPKTVGGVSGVGYFFARRLHKDLGVPVGMLQSFWGGSRIEAWTSREAIEAEPALKPILDWWAEHLAKFEPGKIEAGYREKLKRWQQAAASAKTKGKKPPKKPSPPEDPRTSRHRPACLYNGMIAPLIPYGMRGVISYQGLGNLFWAQYSHVLMPTMIHDWRRRWGQGDFPFGMVQPAPYPCDRRPKSGPDAYALLRESQLLLLSTVPNTGVAPTMDIGDPSVLHFTNKQDVGRRMTAWALATVYGRSLAYSGPVYKSMSVEGDRVRIHFSHADSGLSTKDGNPPTHFTVAGRDKVFHPAAAAIEGTTVVVKSDTVPHPVAVRFAWSDTSVPNLFNGDGLPASLFRTDQPTVPYGSSRPGK